MSLCVCVSLTRPQVRAMAGSLVAGGNPATIFIGNVSDQPVAARTINQQVMLVNSTNEKYDAIKQHIVKVRGVTVCAGLRLHGCEGHGVCMCVHVCLCVCMCGCV